MITKLDVLVGDGQSNNLNCNGTMTIAGGSPGQYKILRQQGSTTGEIEFVDFAVYDTDGTTRLFWGLINGRT